MKRHIQWLVRTDHINILGENIKIIKKNIEDLLDATKKGVVESDT
jgi:hypothetical protein